MKNLLFGLIALLSLVGLLLCADCGTGPQFVAQAVSAQPGTPSPAVPAVPTVVPGTPMIPPAPKPITGDLVIDFMGDIRGYVEPCG